MAKEKQVAKKEKEEKALEPSRALWPVTFEERFDQMERMMDRLFEGFFPRGWPRPLRMEWPSWVEPRVPAVDVIDRDEEVLVRAELPGVVKEDVEVSITEGALTIRGKRKQEKKEERKGEYYRREMRYGEFTRTVHLPTGVQEDKVKATFKDGVLEVTLPKAEAAKRRTIPIKD